MDLSDSLLETAIEDLNSVLLLYNSNHYNIALFQLQQSVEKLVKSFGIKTQTIKPEEMTKKIRHLPHKVFTRFYQNQIIELDGTINYRSLIPDFVPPHQRNKQKLKENLKNLKGLHSKLSILELDSSFTLEENEKFINGAIELDQDPLINDQELFNEIKNDLVKTHVHFINYFKNDENVKSLSEYVIKTSDIIASKELINQKKKLITERKFGFISYVWINLSLVTSPHEQTTRYPSIINNEPPKSIYDINNTLINSIPKFVELLNRSIDLYKEIYEIK
jgi:HEPN domain-containing protein